MNDSPPHQTVSAIPAAALVVSNMIGTGVFMSLGYQISTFHRPDGTSLLTGSVLPIILLWVAGGVLALCGALCYAELATALPRSGGEYHFLSRIYHPVVGFCAGLCSALIGFTAPIAASAVVFGDYLGRVFPALPLAAAPHLLGFILVTIVTLCHLRSLHFTGRFQAAVTGVTVLLICAFVVTGFLTVRPQPVSFAPHAADLNLPLLSAFGGSLIWVMYAYSGWNAAAYIVEEVRDPARALPRALILGTLFVLVLYVAVNSVFLFTTPLAKMAGEPEVAHIAGISIFGPVGARISSALICVGLVANVSGMMWVGSRIGQAMGATYPALSFFGRTLATRVPLVALVAQYAITLVLLCFDPQNLINYVTCVLIFWCLLAVLGVFVLRVREPNLPRPYRTWGYPATPVVFATIALFCLVQTYQLHRAETLVGAGTVLIGVPIYLWARRGTNPAALPDPPLAERAQP